MPNTEEPAVSTETVEMIEGQVKKGKARKFFLIYKGASIKTLGVFKKGPFGPKVLKAKKDGFKGEVCYGLVVGSGKNLVFQLPGNALVADAMKADAWAESPPLKATKLKEFLRDNNLAFKPDFKMITEIGEVLDPESEESVAINVDPSDDDEADEETPVSQTAAEAARQKLKGALQQVTPKIKEFIAAAPDQKSSVLVLVAGIKQVLDDAAATDFSQPTGQFKQLVALLKAGKSVQPSGLSLVELGKARLEWLSSSQNASAAILQLKQHIAEDFANDAPLQNQLSEAIKTLDVLIEKIQVNLDEQLDAVLNASESSRAQLISSAKITITTLLQLVESDPIAIEIDGNEAFPSMTVVEPMRQNLLNIAYALG